MLSQNEMALQLRTVCLQITTNVAQQKPTTQLLMKIQHITNLWCGVLLFMPAPTPQVPPSGGSTGQVATYPAPYGELKDSFDDTKIQVVYMAQSFSTFCGCDWSVIIVVTDASLVTVSVFGFYFRQIVGTAVALKICLC